MFNPSSDLNQTRPYSVENVDAFAQIFWQFNVQQFSVQQYAVLLLLDDLSLEIRAAGPARGCVRGGVSYPGLRDVCGGPAVAQKYKVHQNAPFSEKKIKNFLPIGCLL